MQMGKGESALQSPALLRLLMMSSGICTTLQGQGVLVARACCCGEALTLMRLPILEMLKGTVVLVMDWLTARLRQLMLVIAGSGPRSNGR